MVRANGEVEHVPARRVEHLETWWCDLQDREAALDLSIGAESEQSVDAGKTSDVPLARVQGCRRQRQQ